MLCRNPYLNEVGAAYGCGQCLPCRINRRRIWTLRILLEARKWSENSFVTLTYSEEHVPRLATGQTTLEKSHLQLWLKSLRKSVAPARLRFYGVGEYGESEGARPHFHVALFGYKGCQYFDSRWCPGGPVKECRCASCQIISRTWAKGRVHQGVIERKSAQYIAGYTIKRMTSEEDGRLNGRYPEFARMSLRPGIGADAMHDVADTINNYRLGGDAPGSLVVGRRLLPIGRYLRRRLRVHLGRAPETPEETIDEVNAKLQPLREIASSLSDREVYVPGTFDMGIYKKLLVEEEAERVRQMEVRRKLYERGKK